MLEFTEILAYHNTNWRDPVKWLYCYKSMPPRVSHSDYNTRENDKKNVKNSARLSAKKKLSPVLDMLRLLGSNQGWQNHRQIILEIRLSIKLSAVSNKKKYVMKGIKNNKKTRNRTFDCALQRITVRSLFNRKLFIGWSSLLFACFNWMTIQWVTRALLMGSFESHYKLHEKGNKIGI